jgi:hypothetical protein
MAMFDEYLYIDYENVQDVNVDVIKKTIKVAIIVGQEQSKVPLDLVQKTQPFGQAVDWIQVSGKGRNALDFFIAFFLGRDAALDPGKKFIIYSKDTGYDPLITYLNKTGIKARRIVSFHELNQAKAIEVDESGVRKVRDSLAKVAANKRPKKRSSLNGFIAAMFKNMTQPDVDNLIEDLFIRKIVYEENGIIKYNLEV